MSEQKFNKRPKPPEQAHSIVDHSYLLGYGTPRGEQNPYSTVITPAEIPGRPEYKGETPWVSERIKTPPSACAQNQTSA